MLTFQSFYITILSYYCNITEVFALWFPIDYNSHVPIYKQIEGKIKELIVKGQLREGQFVPSIRVLARDIGVNVNTVARAYRELASEGVIRPIKGEGYVVVSLDSDEFLKEKLQTLREILSNLKEQGISAKEVKAIFEEIFGGDDIHDS